MDPRGRQEELVHQERRVNKVQLARLAVMDLLALLGLPVPQARPELQGKPVRPAHLGPPVSQERRGNQEQQGHLDRKARQGREECLDREDRQAWNARSDSAQKPSP
jgi:hypothetical protein